MNVKLRELQNNPMRDFTIDPIDDVRVAELAKSIKEDGFWGGVVVRRDDDGEFQIAAGHHRVKAAIKAGIDAADLFVGRDLDDESMVRIYARENATQRGNVGTAQAGSIASAIKICAQGIMTGGFPGIPGKLTNGALSLDKLRGQLESSNGIGEDVINRFLDGIPGISTEVVKQQLASLKASGDYARIIGEVKEQLDKENAEALKELARREKAEAQAAEAARKAEEVRKEAAANAKAAKDEAEKQRALLAKERAEIEAKLAEKRRAEYEAEVDKMDALRRQRDTATKAADSANGREITFDQVGVTQWLTNPSHVAAFRRTATSPGVQPYLAVDKQAALAKHIVKTFEKGELTAENIRQTVVDLVMKRHVAQRQIGKAEQLEFERQEAERHVKRLLGDFERACRSLSTSGRELQEYITGGKWKRAGLPLTIPGTFISNVKDAKEILTKLERSF